MPMNASETTRSFNITSLRPFTEYTVTVFARTAIGEGQGTSLTSRTLAGGRFTKN